MLQSLCTCVLHESLLAVIVVRYYTLISIVPHPPPPLQGLQGDMVLRVGVNTEGPGASEGEGVTGGGA